MLPCASSHLMRKRDAGGPSDHLPYAPVRGARRVAVARVRWSGFAPGRAANRNPRALPARAGEFPPWWRLPRRGRPRFAFQSAAAARRSDRLAAPPCSLQGTKHAAALAERDRSRRKPARPLLRMSERLYDRPTRSRRGRGARALRTSQQSAPSPCELHSQRSRQECRSCSEAGSPPSRCSLARRTTSRSGWWECCSSRRRQHCDHGQGGGVPVGQEHLPGAVDSRSSAGTQKFQGCWSLGIAC
jgi:hypothetical protein